MSTKKELKNSLKTLRMPDKLVDEITQEAKDMGSNFNAYAIDILSHRKQPLTPPTMVRIQNLINHACEAVESVSHDKAVELQKEAGMIWKY